MEKLKNRLFIGFPTLLILVIFDRLTKRLAFNNLNLTNHVVELIPGVLELRYLENEGAAFGMLQNRFFFFYLFTFVFITAFLFLYIRMPEDKRFVPLNLLLIFFVAGAFGNFIDRVRYHYVIDFIYFKLINFPIFNVADIYVTVSCFILIVLVLFYYKDDDLNKIKDSLKR
ncbi:MAG: signal peptidase II [Lachnospiraceae bacterium]|nr:signal peptidase II [Lachnospiraceae bacterium]